MDSPTMREIATAVAAEHGFTFADIIRRDTRRPEARARLEAMHACWATKRWSLHQMGHVFQRHHTTVLSAAQKIEGERAALIQRVAA